MRIAQYILILAVVLALDGCSLGRSPDMPGVLDEMEQAIHETLKKDWVPLPATTPYDCVTVQRRSYIDGFRAGWKHAISGALLHSGLVSAPNEVTKDLRKVWWEGWYAGAQKGADRWMAELRDRRVSRKPGSGE